MVTKVALLISYRELSLSNYAMIQLVRSALTKHPLQGLLITLISTTRLYVTNLVKDELRVFFVNNTSFLQKKY